ncbi:MAG TPA: formylglycine-generating enzyme family protein [Candidatus Azoamicus sp. OHIO2]
MELVKILFFLVQLLYVNACFSLDHNLNNEMIFISHGSYNAFFKYSDLVNNVNIADFYINKHPVTNDEFRFFILDKPEWSVENIKSIFADRNYLVHWKDNENFDEIKNYPVVNVSWFAAEAYCSYIGARLPTLDEWEYVASASKYDSNGKNDPLYLQHILDWYILSQSKIVSLDVMTDYNYWGVCCMHGVIWEWVNDFNSVILLNTDAEGGELDEVLYCGATATSVIDPADYVAFMRFAFRNSLEANYTMTTLGFRCAKNFK